MPRIPFGLADAALPSSSGMRGATVGIPAAQEPGLDSDAATLPGRALAGLGQDVGRAGQYLEQAEAYQFQRQRAQDVLDSTLGFQDVLQEFQPAIAERQRTGDYKTLPQDTQKLGRDIAARVALQRKLSPQAKALFQEKVETAITKAQADALGVQTQRFQQEAILGMGRAVQLVQERLGQATDPYDEEVIVGEFKAMSQQWVAAGLIGGAQMVDIEKKTFDAVSDQRNERAIQRDPYAMQAQYRKQLHGEATDPALPTARLESLAALNQQAGQVAQQRLGQQEHAERMADYRFSKEQADNANAIRAELSVITPIPENEAKFDGWIAEVNRFAQARPGGQGPLISGQAQREFLDDLRVLKAAARHPRTTDDGPTEMKATLMIDAADNEQEYEVARRFVNQHATMLKPETVNQKLSQIFERKKSGHYSQQPGVREGFRIITGGDVAEGAFNTFLRGGMREDEQQQMRNALEVYRTRVEEIAKTSIPQANYEAPAIARDVVERYMVPQVKEARLKRLPLTLRGPDGKSGIADEHEVDRRLAEDRNLTDAMKWRLKQQWSEWLKTTVPGTSPTMTPSQGQAPTTGRRERQKVAQ